MIHYKFNSLLPQALSRYNTPYDLLLLFCDSIKLEENKSAGGGLVPAIASPDVGIG